MKVINILFDDRHAGPSRRVILVGRELAAEGIETVLCIPEGNGNAASYARAAGIRVTRLPMERVPRPRDLPRVVVWGVKLPRDVLRFIRLYRRERATIVHVSGAFFWAPAIAAKIARLPLVWHLNDTVIPAPVAPLFGRLVSLLADQVIAEAGAVARHYGVHRRPHNIVHAPVDTEKFPQTPRDGGEVGGGFRIGIIANWNPLKDHPTFLRAVSRARDASGRAIRVVLAGARLDTHPAYAEEVEELIDALDLRDAVEDMGFVSDIEAVIMGLDMVVLSSISEACPQAVLEAMAAGRPVVATDVGGVRELLLGDPGAPAGIVVPPGDSAGLAAGIVTIMQNSDRARRMGISGRSRAARLYSVKRSAHKHRHIYSALVRSPATPTC